MTPIAIAVVEWEGRFLIAQRPAGVALAGLWEFPGGKVEPGETPEAAAVRECREETGLEVRIVSQYPEQVQRYDHDRVHLHFFACRPLDATASPHQPWQWVERRELGRYEFPEGNRGLLELLLGTADDAFLNDYMQMHIYVMLGLRCDGCGAELECLHCFDDTLPGEPGAAVFSIKAARLACEQGWTLKPDVDEPRFYCPKCGS